MVFIDTILAADVIHPLPRIAGKGRRWGTAHTHLDRNFVELS
jgi:hypothetical protein